MHKSKDELYELVKDIKTREEFEAETQKHIIENNGLFDEETAALFIVDKLGRNKQHICTISELQPNMDCTLFGKIMNLQEPKNFKRTNGSRGRVANVDITDNTGVCRLVLWNDDVELVENKTIQKGSIVKIVNGYTKDGFDGIEIHVGRWGQMDVDPEDAPEELTNRSPVVNNNQNTNLEITGELTEIQPTRAFFKDNGEFGFVTNITVKNIKKEEKHLIIWDTKVKEIQRLKVGDHIMISNINMRNKNGKTEIHVSRNSIIQKI